MSEQLSLRFDYSVLEPQHRGLAMEAATAIRMHGKRAAESIVAIGEELAKVKAAVGHGHYLDWIQVEFGWSDQHARNFANAAAWAKSKNFLDLGLIDASALYLLGRPSTPDEVSVAAVERARTGERVTYSSVRDDLERSKPRPASPPGGGVGSRSSGSDTWSPADIPQWRKPAPAPEPEPESEIIPPMPQPDPAAQAAFRAAAALGGRLRDFEPLLAERPTAVAQAVPDELWGNVLQSSYRLQRWLDDLISELENMDAQAA